MTTSSDDGRGDARRALRRTLGLDPSWTVRFTADERRAREMARGYRAAGYRARVVPLFPEGKRGEGDGPVGGAAACTRCLDGTHVVATRPTGREPGPVPELPYG